MKKGKTLQRMFGIGLLAMMFGAGPTYAQTGQESPSSASPPETSGSSATTGGSASGAGSAMESKSSGSSAGSSSASQGGSSLSQSDQNMMKQLSYANMAEIEAAQMALDKSQDQQVKTFAQKMIDDHTKASDQLRDIADAKNVKLPTELDAKHKKEVQNLSKLSGDKFDKKYLSQGGVSDHRQVQQLLSRIEKRAKDDQLKTLASTLMPTINEHWQMAKEMTSSSAATKPPATGSSGTMGSGKAGGATSSSGSSGASESSGTSGSEKTESK